MPDLHFTSLVEGSAETVFALIADLAHYDRWLPGSKAFGTITQIAPLPVGLGTTYIDAGPAGTRHGEVTEYHPPTRISCHQPMEVKKPLKGTIDIHLRHTLEPGEQMTRVDRDLTIQVHGLLKVAHPFVVASFRKENDRMLQALKRYAVEQTSCLHCGIGNAACRSHSRPTPASLDFFAGCRAKLAGDGWPE